MTHQLFRLAQTCEIEAKQAVQSFYAAVVQPDTELVIFFCSSEYDLDVVASEMRRLFVGIRVIGCTTAGEIGPAGYCQHSLSGVGCSKESCISVSGRLAQISQFDITQGNNLAQELLQQLEHSVKNPSQFNTFAFLLIDGLSLREEPVTHALQNALGKIPLFGGSAGDDLKLKKTFVYSEGGFHSDAAVLVLISTQLPFRLFKTQHFISSPERLVVTEADSVKRIVSEINGLPAAAEYARLIGVDVNALNSETFASFPMLVKIGGIDYVRSIQRANADGSLGFYCAVDTGLVLRVAHGLHFVENLAQAFNAIRAEIGPLQLVLGCDCILRNIEATQHGWKSQVGEIFKCYSTVGFSGYGEQLYSVHNNQTFTGCAIGFAPQLLIGERDV